MADTIHGHLGQDHKRCDTLYSESEALVADGQWEAAAERFRSFHDAMERHFLMEEEVFFPRFEKKTGMTGGPTQVMRMEHLQMRQVMGQMENDLEKKDRAHFLGLGETFMILMQQHNMKEEQILYAMGDRVFGAEAPALIADMEAVEA